MTCDDVECDLDWQRERRKESTRIADHGSAVLSTARRRAYYSRLIRNFNFTW